jgi:anion-transporting  ArsA/GET3 family ATPase
LAAEAAFAFSRRFRKTEALMHSAAVNFVLVTTPGEDRLNEAFRLARLTQRQKFNLRGIVLNRMLDERSFEGLTITPRCLPAHLADIAGLRNVLGEDAANDARLAAVIDCLEQYAAQQRAEVERAARFARGLPRQIALTMLPAIELGVRDLRALAKLAAFLTHHPRPGRQFVDDAAAAFAIPTRERLSRAAQRAKPWSQTGVD